MYKLKLDPVEADRDDKIGSSICNMERLWHMLWIHERCFG